MLDENDPSFGERATGSPKSHVPPSLALFLCLRISSVPFGAIKRICKSPKNECSMFKHTETISSGEVTVVPDIPVTLSVVV